MFGIFKKKFNVDTEFKEWSISVFNEQVQRAASIVHSQQITLNISPDEFIGGYMAGIVDGCFQRANEGHNREKVLATTKAVFVEIYEEVRGESFFNLVVQGMIEQKQEYIEAYTKGLQYHEWHHNHNSVMPHLSHHIARKSGFSNNAAID